MLRIISIVVLFYIIGRAIPSWASWALMALMFLGLVILTTIGITKKARA
jgi:hypothetical protein